MKKITYLLTLLLMYVGVMPMMAAYENLELDESKTYTIKNSAGQYLYLKTSGSYKYPYVTYGGDVDASDEKCHFVFENSEKTTNNYTIYYIRPKSSSDYTYYAEYNSTLGVFVRNKKTEWCVVTDENGNHFISKTNLTDFWKTSSLSGEGNPLEVSSSLLSGHIRELKIEEVGGSEPEPEVPSFSLSGLYRIKNKCMDLSKDGQNKQANGQGAYLGSTYHEVTDAWAGMLGDVHCSTTSLADAGCVWMVEGDNATGFTFKNLNNGLYLTYNGNFGFSSSEYKFMMEQNESYYRIKQGDNYVHAAYAGIYAFALGEQADKADWEFVPATELQVNLNEYVNSDHLGGELNGYYATLYLPFDVTYTSASGLGVHAITVDGNNAWLSGALDQSYGIPANTGVVLKGTSDTYTLTISTSALPALSESNDLMGTNVDLALSSEAEKMQYYVLGLDNNSGRLGLRNPSVNVDKVPANRAFLKFDSYPVNALQFMVGEPTAIESVVTGNSESAIYDLSGRRVLSTVKGGLYIQNGKKFIVK